MTILINNNNNFSTERISETQTLSFPPGLFHGKENGLRITDDKKWVSVYDVIKMVGDQSQPKKTWIDIKNQYPEVVTKSNYFKFSGQGQRETPVVNAKGLVLLLMHIPGEKAKQFRYAGANILVRYLGGDTTLIEEVQAINEAHIQNPDNPAAIFRNDATVQQNLKFTRDQVNQSKKLLTHFGNKTNIFYSMMFSKKDTDYIKFGIVHLRPLQIRYQEHEKEFENICCVSAMQCKDVTKVESDFKKTPFYLNNKTQVAKSDNSGYHTEVFELNENVTIDTIKKEILDVAGDRILDPLPPQYNEVVSLDVEKEKTKQIELQTKSQIDIEREKTRQMELQLEMMKLSQGKSSLALPAPSNGSKKEPERTPLYKFLVEKSTFKKGSMMLMSDIRKQFEAWIGSPVKDLDNGTFTQVNEDFVIKREHICKLCLRKAGFGCCEEYTRKDRIFRTVIYNIEL